MFDPTYNSPGPRLLVGSGPEERGYLKVGSPERSTGGQDSQDRLRLLQPLQYRFQSEPGEMGQSEQMTRRVRHIRATSGRAEADISGNQGSNNPQVGLQWEGPTCDRVQYVGFKKSKIKEYLILDF